MVEFMTECWYEHKQFSESNLAEVAVYYMKTKLFISFFSLNYFLDKQYVILFSIYK